MAIFEIIGGPITHKYLMNKTKWDLAGLCLEYVKLYNQTKDELDALNASQKADPADGKKLCGCKISKPVYTALCAQCGLITKPRG